MERNLALAIAASELVGAPFRLQGRDPVHGLDCIGLLLASLDRIGVQLQFPADYHPRRRQLEIPEESLRRAGFERAPTPRMTGDILLLRTAPTQAHLAIAQDATSIIHAHAGLGRVVAGPLPESWPIIATWRFGPRTTPEGDPEWQR